MSRRTLKSQSKGFRRNLRKACKNCLLRIAPACHSLLNSLFNVIIIFPLCVNKSLTNIPSTTLDCRWKSVSPGQRMMMFHDEIEFAPKLQICLNIVNHDGTCKRNIKFLCFPFPKRLDMFRYVSDMTPHSTQIQVRMQMSSGLCVQI